MTLNWAIKQLHELRSAEDMPIYYKPAIAEVINVLLMDTQEVRHGRWIKITNDWADDAQYVCSCCGRLLTVSNRLTELVSMSYPYCHCGSKMDGKDE